MDDFEVRILQSNYVILNQDFVNAQVLRKYINNYPLVYLHYFKIFDIFHGLTQ